MTFSDLITSSFDSLRRTKSRSMITMSGIIIGVMAVILMLSIGEAAQRFIVDQISSFGSNTIFVANGPSSTQGQPSLFTKGSLTMKDVTTIHAQTWIEAITGLDTQQDELIANGLDTSVEVMGTMPDELQLNDLQVAQGTFLSDADVTGHTRNAVLGSEIANSAFGNEDPLGRIVKISGQGFRVIGVMKSAGTKAFQNTDKNVYVPVTAALDLYNKQYLTEITLRSSLPVNTAKIQLQYLLRDSHHLDNPSGDLTKDDFNVQTQADLIQTVDQITNILKILLISIAAISLLVGGIGIMNIMYVTVTERTHEIGLRKALGAKQGDILGQFLFEAGLLTTAGGAIGTALGISGAWLSIALISLFQSGWTFAISWSSVALGVGVSAAIGIIFGYFPARGAAKLNPIEALRVE